MKKFYFWAGTKLRVDFRLIIIYCAIYFLWGIAMNWLGTEVSIARFANWWQVLSVYVVYMVPVSLLVRGLPVHMQYAYGLIAMGLLEFSGYALNTSYAFPDNILDKFFGIRNFSLAMALFFAWYFPLGNWAVRKIFNMLFGAERVAG